MAYSARIENWDVLPAASGYRLVGDVYGHPRFFGGEHVYTGLIIEVDRNVVKTDRTIYQLGQPSDGALARLRASRATGTDAMEE